MTGEQFEQYDGCYGLQEEPTVILKRCIYSSV